MKYTCIAIDDEFPATQIVKTFVEKLPQIDLLATFTNAAEAMNFLMENSVDILFLDIQMPQITGIEFTQSLRKKHQIILGFYTGTILYSVIILMSLGSYKPSEGYTGFSTILAAMFGVICVTLFVYFIHSISSAIQIDNIVKLINIEHDIVKVCTQKLVTVKP